MNILYEDNHLLVLNKRPGEIVQGDKTVLLEVDNKLYEPARDALARFADLYFGTPSPP